jgi:hypothetical protein
MVLALFLMKPTTTLGSMMLKFTMVLALLVIKPNTTLGLMKLKFDNNGN